MQTKKVSSDTPYLYETAVSYLTVYYTMPTMFRLEETGFKKNQKNISSAHFLDTNHSLFPQKSNIRVFDPLGYRL